MIFLKRVLLLGAIALILYGLYLCSYSVQHGEINFYNDVARDFLLLREVNEKKIVLIGPRANSTGLFHGPLWTYINYPVFLLGKGNPVVVGWFWVFLLAVFLVTSFFIMKNTFSVFPAIAFVLLMQVRLVSFMNGLTHALSIFLFVPAYVYTMYYYLIKKQSKFLLCHLIALCIIIQLNIGVGGALTVLSMLLSVVFIIKNRLWPHMANYFVIPLGLINFIIFNIRHNFLMVRPMMTIASRTSLIIPLSDWIQNRINNTVSMQFLQDGNSNPFHILEITFILILIFTIIRLRKKEHRIFYLLITYFYFGYMILTFVNKGIILTHFVFLLIPMTSLWLVSFLEQKYIIIFLPIVILLFYFNSATSQQYCQSLPNGFSNVSPYSWKSLSTVAQAVIQKTKGIEFGYYVFSPDSYAYQPRYAMLYYFEKTHSLAYEYKKKPVTYVIAAPPPPGNPYMNEVWWIKTPVKIKSDPVETVTFPSGYKIEKFLLSPEEQKIPHDKTIELGLFFR